MGGRYQEFFVTDDELRAEKIEQDIMEDLSTTARCTKCGDAIRGEEDSLCGQCV